MMTSYGLYLICAIIFFFIYIYSFHIIYYKQHLSFIHAEIILAVDCI